MLPDVETIPALLALRRRDDGDRRALVTADDAITYAGLDTASADVAARLVAAGVGAGDRVGLLGPNGIDWATTALGVMRIGAVLVPLSTLLRPPELLAQLTIADVTHLITATEFRGRRYLDDLDAAAPGVRDELAAGRRHPGVPTLRAVWRLSELIAPRAPASGEPTSAAAQGSDPVDPTDRADTAVADPADAADGGTVVEGTVTSDLVAELGHRVERGDDLVVLFTSGSRGAPKGCIHTHGGALRATAAGLDARRIGPGERLYIPMPFFWTGGFAGGLLTALVAGATLLTEAEPEPERTLDLLVRERATLFRGWPDQAARLAAHPAFAVADLSSLGDGSLGPVLPAERRPAPGARANLFGMTESFGPWCGDRLDVDLPPGKHGSCGRPFAGVEVRVTDPDTGDALPTGEPGELWLRGPNLLRGMCGRTSDQVFTPDGFYRTGDLGRVDDDGYVWYSGRLDDMVKVKGANVYPSEVEGALRSLDAVRQAYVTDLPAGDDPARREIGAVVVTDAPLADVVAAVRQRLSAFKVPTRWLPTTDAALVPMTATGKVDKPGLQALLARDGAPHRTTPPTQPADRPTTAAAADDTADAADPSVDATADPTTPTTPTGSTTS